MVNLVLRGRNPWEKFCNLFAEEHLENLNNFKCNVLNYFGFLNILLSTWTVFSMITFFVIREQILTRACCLSPRFYFC